MGVYIAISSTISRVRFWQKQTHLLVQSMNWMCKNSQDVCLSHLQQPALPVCRALPKSDLVLVPVSSFFACNCVCEVRIPHAISADQWQWTTQASKLPPVPIRLWQALLCLISAGEKLHNTRETSQHRPTLVCLLSIFIRVCAVWGGNKVTNHMRLFSRLK